jgi:hypothetical protein
VTFNPFNTFVAPWQPPDNNLLAAAGDPFGATAANALIAGTQYLFKITARNQPLPVANLWFLPSAAAAGASTGTFAGLISSAGAVLATSADAGALLATTNPVPIPLTVPQVIQAGTFAWGVLLTNIVTQPSLRCGIGATGGPANVNLTPATARFATNGTALAALTAISPAANVVASFCPWWGVS